MEEIVRYKSEHDAEHILIANKIGLHYISEGKRRFFMWHELFDLIASDKKSWCTVNDIAQEKNLKDFKRRVE